MDKTQDIKYPYLINSFIDDDGIQVSRWRYNGLPDEMRRAYANDFYTGRPFLYRPRSGRIFLSDVFRPATEDFVLKSLAKGRHIYVNSNNMEHSEEEYPYKLELGIYYRGQTVPIWVYNRVPEGMKRATSMADFYYGRLYLYRSTTGNKSEYLTSIFRPTVRETVREMLERGHEIYIK